VATKLVYQKRDSKDEFVTNQRTTNGSLVSHTQGNVSHPEALNKVLS